MGKNGRERKEEEGKMRGNRGKIFHPPLGKP